MSKSALLTFRVWCGKIQLVFKRHNTTKIRDNKMTEAEMDRRYAALAKGKADKPSNNLRDRCRGALWGTIVGDALFQPIEFAAKLNHPWIDRMTDGKVWGLPAGYYTDDSSMMFCIMQGYLDDTKHYKVENIARAFVRWMDEGRWSSTGRCFDIGTSCAAGLRAFKLRGSIKNGTEWSRGCGGIMRFASSWMVGHKEGHGSRLESLGVMMGINNIDHFNGECLRAIEKLADIYDSHLLDNRRTKQKSAYATWRDATGGGDAYGCLETALWAFNTTNNFRDAVIASGNVGGDTDSVAAVAGGIAGSWYGYDAIPREWLESIPERMRIWGFTERFLDATIGDRE